MALVGLIAAVSCDRSSSLAEPASPIQLVPRVERASSVTDSVWNLAASVHVRLVATDGTLLLDDTVLFSNHRAPTVKAPGDQGVIVTLEGLDNLAAVVWTGSTTLPPGSRDTTFSLTVGSAKRPDTGTAPTNGAANPPTFQSTDIAAWAPNTYDQPLHVFLSSTTPGSILHYGLDGILPSASSAVASVTGIAIDSSCTLGAIAVAPGWSNSTGLVRSFTFKTQPPTIASLGAKAWATDTFDQSVQVKLASATPGAEIRYTLDGTDPTRSSSLFQDSLLIDSSLTLKAVAFRGRNRPSDLLTKVFAMQVRPVVVASLSATEWAENSYDQPVTTRLSCPTPGARIHYTLDGSEPDSSSPVYSNTGIAIDSTKTLKARAFKPMASPSAAGFSRRFVLQIQPVVIAADGNQGWPPFRIGMSTATKGAVIHYVATGRDPTSDSALYTDSLGFGKLDDSTTYSAIAVDPLHPKVSPSMISRNRFGWTVPWSQSIHYGIVTDTRDGQGYRTIRIGTRTWMAENLNFAADSSWYRDYDTRNFAVYGRIYNWASAMGSNTVYNSTVAGLGETGIQGLCPDGWHIPSLADWTALTDTALNPAGAGTALKAAISGTWGWSTPGTDASGLRMLPATGFSFGTLDETHNSGTAFWSTSEVDASNAHYLALDNGSSAQIGADSKYDFLPLRCVEN